MATNVSLASAAPAIVSHKGVAIAAAVVPSLAGRSITSYAQSFMIAGIIISVIGVAAAIFTSVLLTGVGFGFAGIVSVIGVFVAQSAFEGEQLQNSITQLKGQNAFLDDQRVKLDACITLLKRENDDLKLSQGSLDLRCKELEGQNTRIHQLSTDLGLSLQGMTAANHVLSESKSVLIAKVAELQGYVAEAKATLQTFVATHKEFSSRVGIFAGAIANLDTTEEVIRSAIADLETRATTSLPVLREHVTLSRDISDYIQTRVQEQSQQQSGSIDAYRQEVAALGTHIESLQGYIRELERINAGFSLQMQGSQSIESLQGEHREALTSLIRTLDESSGRFERERGLFRSEAERLQTTFRALVVERDALLRSLQQPLQTLATADRGARLPAVTAL
jgi:chromosome segregation ATPase